MPCSCRGAASSALGLGSALGVAEAFGLACALGVAGAVARAAGFAPDVFTGFCFAAGACVFVSCSGRAARFALRRWGRECGSDPITVASDLSLMSGPIVLTRSRSLGLPGYALPLSMQYFQQAAFWRLNRALLLQDCNLRAVSA
jgi:hypothetical protein